jgi:creatinine amidohydrolase/Fe(II)-dependent formamide hydrolase-like protein
MYKEGQPILFEKLSWDEAAQFGQDPGLIIFCPGGLDQCGPHLPLDTTASINFEIACRVSARLGVPVHPKIRPAVSGPQGRFPGTVSIDPVHLAYYLYDLVRSCIEESGFRQLLLLNGHPWNLGPLLSVRDNIRCDYRDVQIRLINWWNFDYEVAQMVLEDTPSGRMISSNKASTSCMLAIDPEAVAMDRARELAVNAPEVSSFWELRTDQVSAHGAIGSSILEASAEHGEAILSLAADKLTAQLRAAMLELPRYHRRIKLPGVPF